MDLELKLDFSSIYVYMYTVQYIPIEFRKDVFHQIKNHHNYHIMYINQNYVSSKIDMAR